MANDLPRQGKASKKKINWKLISGGIVIAAGLIYLLISSTLNNVQYFLTIDEVLADQTAYLDKQVRISGAVIGDSIQVSSDNQQVAFTVANISSDHKEIAEKGGMALALEEAVSNPNTSRLQIVYHGAKPDLLKDQSQAIVTGRLTSAAVFEADELLLKCPSKYESASQ
jgi:cytochrome c-type biogenesis protein CcmE